MGKPRNRTVLKPDELDFIAQLIAIFSLFIAGFFLAAGQETRSAWISLIGGGLIAGFLFLYATYTRLYG